MQEPKSRPTARYLLQHRVVVQQQAGEDALLQPLIAHTQKYVAVSGNTLAMLLLLLLLMVMMMTHLLCA